MADQLTVQDLLVCFQCGNLNANWQPEQSYALECRHVMCVVCDYEKQEQRPDQTLHCRQCKMPRAIDYTFTQELLQADPTYYDYYCRQLIFALVPCHRCPLDFPRPNCPFDHSLYTHPTISNAAIQIEIKVCGKCKVRSEDARCARCKGNLDRLTISKPQKLVFPPQLVFPYGQ